MSIRFFVNPHEINKAASPLTNISNAIEYLLVAKESLSSVVESEVGEQGEDLAAVNSAISILELCFRRE